MKTKEKEHINNKLVDILQRLNVIEAQRPPSPRLLRVIERVKELQKWLDTDK